MNDTFLNTIILTCAGLITLIAFGEEIKQKTKLKFAGNFLFKIIVTIVALLIGGWATIQKDKNSSSKFSDFQTQTQKDNRLRDSLHNANDIVLEKEYERNLIKNDSNNLRNYSDVLAKYNLQYIQNQNKIVSLVRDSSNREIPDLQFGVADPVSSLKYNASKDSIIGFVSIGNTGNCPIFADLMAYVVSQKGNEFNMIPGKIAWCRGRITIHQILTKPIRIFTSGHQFDEIHFLIQGEIKSVDRKVRTKIDEIVSYDLNDNSLGIPLISAQEAIRKYISDRGFK